ncbi:hypothetical protein AVEN_250184-1 [Araneus ventricosus]|uniref:Uncharacterized protein n=1 Tax=Araneus ventricosus TaxID=182803 RepID=A0A4Y2PBT8_ARAVE|nr:hypothetical protein AVEN_250184-1 [Araneus ventricosus]
MTSDILSGRSLDEKLWVSGITLVYTEIADDTLPICYSLKEKQHIPVPYYVDLLESVNEGLLSEGSLPYFLNCPIITFLYILLLQLIPNIKSISKYFIEMDLN